MSEAAAAIPARRRLPRWAWVVLIASLAANLFVVGVVARAMWPARYATAGGGPGGLLGNLVAYGRTLPADRWAAVRPGRNADRPFETLRPLREEMRKARREAAQVFAADPFDRKAFLAAEDRLQAAERAMRSAVVQLAADVAARMTPAERAGFLKWRGLRGGPGGRGGGGHAERDPADAAPAKKASE